MAVLVRLPDEGRQLKYLRPFSQHKIPDRFDAQPQLPIHGFGSYANSILLLQLENGHSLVLSKEALGDENKARRILPSLAGIQMSGHLLRPLHEPTVRKLQALSHQCWYGRGGLGVETDIEGGCPETAAYFLLKV